MLMYTSYLSFKIFVSRETLLGQLTVYIRQLRDDFVSRTSHSGDKGPPKGKNLPEIVNNIVWVRQLEAKVSNFSICSALVCLLMIMLWGKL
jgi:dynein heavy chain 2